MSRGLIARQDQVDAMSEQDESDVSVVDVVDGADVESDLIDAAEEEVEVRDFEEDLDKAEAAVESMEALIDCIQYTIENEGGLTKGGAMLVNLASNILHQQMGDTPEASFSPEAYGDDSDRLSMTEASLEGVKDTLASWWQAIKKFFSEMWTNLKSFIVSIFSATEKSIRRAGKVKKAAKEVSDKWKNGKLTEDQQKRFGKKLVISHMCKSLSDTASHANDVMGTVSDVNFITKTLQWAKEYANFAVETESSPAEIAEYNDEVRKVIGQTISTNLIADGNLSKIWNQGEGGEYFRTEEMPGNVALCVYISKPSALNAYKVGFMQIMKPNDNIKFTAFPTYKDVNMTCDHIISICEKRKKAGNVIKSFGSKMESILKIVEKSQGKKDVSLYKRIVLALRNFATSVTRPFTQMAKYSVTVCKTMLDLCVIAIKEAGKKEKDKKDK